MKRPSIFSKNYDKEVKQRKKIILLLIIMPIIGLSIFLITDTNALVNKGISMKNGINNILSNKSKDNIKEEDNKAAEVKKESEKVVKEQSSSKKSEVSQVESDSQAGAATKNESFIVLLSDGQKISVEFSETKAEKSIKGVVNAKDISYDISPSKKAIVIQNTKNQDVLYVDVNKTSKDITKKVYVSSKNVSFTKQQQIKKNPAYIWSVTPKFIDEDNIAYVSELPWLNKKEIQYIWKVNLKNNTHVQVQRASGKKIVFDKITSKGLAANIDGNVVFVTTLGKIIK